MELLLVASAALMVIVATTQLARAVTGERGSLIDLAEDDGPLLDLEYLRSGISDQDQRVLANVNSELSLGARLLAADRAVTARRQSKTVMVRRHRRSEPLSAKRAVSS